MIGVEATVFAELIPQIRGCYLEDETNVRTELCLDLESNNLYLRNVVRETEEGIVGEKLLAQIGNDLYLLIGVVRQEGGDIEPQLATSPGLLESQLIGLHFFGIISVEGSQDVLGDAVIEATGVEALGIGEIDDAFVEILEAPA